MTVRRVVRVVIRGGVQGVGFRVWTQHQAQLHGLSGWVRNRRDGSVEAVLAGSPDLVEVMLKACRTGPRGSLVESVDVFEENEADVGDRNGFEVRPTA